MTLSEFLLARIAEDEALADRSIQIGTKGAALVHIGQPDAPLTLIMHPARVLAECEAKRRIVERLDVAVDANSRGEFGGQKLLGLLDACYVLAAVYVDHPDYDPEWSS